MNHTVKDLFTSRFGENGILIQADFSQLEWRAAAYLSQDPEMISDIFSGLDIHKQSASWAFEIDSEYITKEQRTEAKKITFGPLYGQGAKGLSINSGLDIDSCRAFLKSFYEKYCRLKKWHEEIADEVRNNQQGPSSWIRSPSSRRYWLEERESPQFMKDKGIFKSFLPTEYKNYKVQGTASDILIIQRGNLFRKLLIYRSDCVIVNTVHDSVILDCKLSIKDDVIILLKSILEDTTNIDDTFDTPFNIPLNVDISYGDSWSNLKEVEL